LFFGKGHNEASKISCDGLKAVDNIQINGINMQNAPKIKTQCEAIFIQEKVVFMRNALSSQLI
jgi:hypothetical protein